MASSHPRQDAKCFIGGLSWSTTAEKLEQYFSNFGQVLEAFVSYDRHTGRPRGFGFVVFEDPAVADKVASLQHTIDRREVEAKKAVPKEEHPGPRSQTGALPSGRTKKVFVGGLAPSVDEAALRQYFEQFGPVEDAVVMYDHDNRRPRGFGFVTFASEESVDTVLLAGPLQALHDKQIEIKRAVPRDQMPPPRGLPVGGRGAPAYVAYGRGNPYGNPYAAPYQLQGPGYGLQPQGFGQTAYSGYPPPRGNSIAPPGLGAPGLGAQLGNLGGSMPGSQLGLGTGLAGLNTAGFPPYGATGLSPQSMPDLTGLGGMAASLPTSFGQQNHYGTAGAMGMSAGLSASLGATPISNIGSNSLGSGSFQMSSLQNALPAVATGGGMTDSFSGAAAGGQNSAYATPVAPPQSPGNAAAAATPAAYITSSPSAFDNTLGSPMGSGLAIPQLPGSAGGAAGSLGRHSPGMGGLQSSFTDAAGTPLGSANWS